MPMLRSPAMAQHAAGRQQHSPQQRQDRLHTYADQAQRQRQKEGIIQASWNWPFNRKDMDIYGRTGYVRVPDQNRLRVRRASGAESDAPVPPLAAPGNDPLSYLAAVVRGEVRSTGLSSLEVNLIATEMLDAARESARTSRRVNLAAEGGQ